MFISVGWRNTFNTERSKNDGNGNIKNPLTRLTFTAEQVPFGPEANFVTKEEHQKLYEEVRSMHDMVETIYNSLK